MEKKRLIVMAIMTMGLSFSLLPVKAEDALPPKELETIVVTSHRYPHNLSRVPAAVTVITEEQIKNSSASNLLDLFRRVSTVNVKDYYGNGVKAAVDILGFGEQAALNTVVLIDNRRINEIDMSAVDWAQIPLSQIKRIEIVRGGGGVLYGDNATGGVINIITKEPQEKPSFSFGARAGSYDLMGNSFNFSGKNGDFRYLVDTNFERSHGYRKNSYHLRRDFLGKFGYELNAVNRIRFSSGWSGVEYGMPGALSSQDIINHGYRYSKYPDDYAKSRQYYFSLGWDTQIAEANNLNTEVSFKRKYTYSNFIGANGGWNPFLRSRIDTTGVSLKDNTPFSLGGINNDVLIGIDVYLYDYGSDSYNVNDILQDATDINKRSSAFYLQDEVMLSPSLLGLWGMRYEQARYDFDYHDNSGWNPDIDSKKKTRLKAYQFALLYNYTDDSAIFLDVKRNFRSPAADEYFSWGALNTNLKPQISTFYELGLRHREKDVFNIEAGLFWLRTKHELYYNPATYSNENYPDPTDRRGLELKADCRLNNLWELSGAYTFMHPTFSNGIYKDKIVPLVPRHKATAGISLLLGKKGTFNIAATYVGKRYFINDQANRFSPLNDYINLDTTLRYVFGDFELVIGAFNLTNKKYAEYGVCNANTGAKNYYPSPGRNLRFQINYKF